MKNLGPQLAFSDHDITKCFDVMAELRTHLEYKTFLATVREMEQQGFQLAFIEDDCQVVAVAGFRIAQNLFLGKHLYIDDIVTSHKQRSKGYGRMLYQWLRAQALEAGCGYIHLDSAVHRRETHRFYFQQGLSISSFHFREKLESD